MANQADPPEVMTSSTWLEKANEHKNALRTLIQNYHPASNGQTQQMPITAPGAEMACANVRSQIAAEDAAKAPPVEQL